MKSFILLSSFVHGFAFLGCAAQCGINCFLWFRHNGFRNYPPTLSFKLGQIVRV